MISSKLPSKSVAPQVSLVANPEYLMNHPVTAEQVAAVGSIEVLRLLLIEARKRAYETRLGLQDQLDMMPPARAVTNRKGDEIKPRVRGQLRAKLHQLKSRLSYLFSNRRLLNAEIRARERKTREDHWARNALVRAAAAAAHRPYKAHSVEGRTARLKRKLAQVAAQRSIVGKYKEALRLHGDARRLNPEDPELEAALLQVIVDLRPRVKNARRGTRTA